MRMKENKQMLKLKYHQGERYDPYRIRTDNEAECTHCSAIFDKNSKNIKEYFVRGYLCEDCKFLVSENLRKIKCPQYQNQNYKY